MAALNKRRMRDQCAVNCELIVFGISTTAFTKTWGRKTSVSLLKGNHLTANLTDYSLCRHDESWPRPIYYDLFKVEQCQS
jgi:hypothetical protein